MTRTQAPYPLENYYADLGLKFLEPEYLDCLLRQAATHQAVQRFLELLRQQREVGDDAANRAFYQCFYTEKIPGLELTWADAYACAYLVSYEGVSLPDVEYFCRAHEVCTSVLDAGCGSGLVLCYLARRLPAMRFVGVDRCRPALDEARARLAKLGLTNVELHEGDVYSLPAKWRERFDGAVLRNIIDDTREPSSEFTATHFRTREKLVAIRPALKMNARVYVGLTPYPSYSQAFEARVQSDLAAAGFHAPPAQQLAYTRGPHSCTHLVWTITPAQPPAASPAAQPHRPEYVARYH